ARDLGSQGLIDHAIKFTEACHRTAMPRFADPTARNVRASGAPAVRRRETLDQAEKHGGRGWTAFALTRRPPTKRYTYGFHRSEDIAGVLVVGLIAFSAAVAADQAIDRLLHSQPITDLGWVMAAGILGFVGNEVVAVFRIRVGTEIGSAALIADGY